MFVIAIQTELNSLACCAETNVMTRTGYQIIAENEVFFVSKERFLDKYKGNLYLMPGTHDTLLSFEQASALRDTIIRLESQKLIKVKGSNTRVISDRDGAHYDINVSDSDIDIKGSSVLCQFSGNNCNVRIVTRNSSIDATSSNSTFEIIADDTVVMMFISGCFVELSGNNLEVMLIGSNNTVCGITEGITVFSRGKKNEFRKRQISPIAESIKNC